MSYFARILAQLCASDPSADVSKVVAKALPRARALDDAITAAIANERKLLRDELANERTAKDHTPITKESAAADREKHEAPHRGRKFPSTERAAREKREKPPEPTSGELELAAAPPAPPLLPAAVVVDDKLEDTDRPPPPAVVDDEDDVDELPREEDLVEVAEEPEPTPAPRVRRPASPPAKKKKKSKR